VVRRLRLDSELVRRGLVPSRERAAAAIELGRVRVAGRPATKASTVVDASTSIVLEAGDDPGYASRGAFKLLAAIEAFGPASVGASRTPAGEPAPQAPAGPPVPADGPPGPPRPPGPPLVVAGRRCLDAGASTGGFTDVLLRHGAAAVVAVDVGYGQLAWRLRTDPRVTVLERTNVRRLTREQVGGGVTVVVADLSFISLRLVLPALRDCAEPEADFVVLVKPQFEVGRERLGAGGVVRDAALHAEAVAGVAAAGAQLSLGVRGVVASPLPGPAGNVEYLLWMSRAGAALDAGMLAAAIAAGPAGSTRPRALPQPQSQPQPWARARLRARSGRRGSPG
jgi:23S rRNA (cytidine1920-2'-O)/16S rRNA (cytidine1409-2'-O)-methyltransferase